MVLCRRRPQLAIAGSTIKRIGTTIQLIFSRDTLDVGIYTDLGYNATGSMKQIPADGTLLPHTDAAVNTATGYYAVDCPEGFGVLARVM